MAEASRKYSGLDGLGVSEFVFYFEGTDDDLVLTRIDKDSKVLAPSENDWTTAKNSNEAKQAYNIARYGRTTGSSINVADDDILYARYLVEFGNENNAATNPTELETADRNFYRNGVITRPRQYQSPSSVRYGRGESLGGAYAYPLNIDLTQDHLQINKFEYTRDGGANLSRPTSEPAGNSARGTREKGTVILPMPKVSDSNGAEWGESDLNVFGVGAVSAMKFGSDAVKAAIGAGFNIEEIKKAMKGLKAPVPKGEDIGASVQVAGALGGAELLKTLGITVEPDALLARSTGNIINPNAELLFQGPVLRDFGFQYLMIARSREEGKQIRKIIRWFKQGAAPKYRNQALLGTPDIFSLKYITPGNPGIMNKFNDLALRTVTVDYAPDGFWSAYEDSQPVAVRMSLQFTELKPVYDKDQNKSPDDNSVGY
jgi:hypothetical protein